MSFKFSLPIRVDLVGFGVFSVSYSDLLFDSCSASTLEMAWRKSFGKNLAEIVYQGVHTKRGATFIFEIQDHLPESR